MKNPFSHFMHSYLRKLGIRIDILRINDLYERHPLPHSIRALSDTLDGLHVENMVCTLDFEQLSEIEGPFVVVAGKDELPFFIVEGMDNELRQVRLQSGTGRRFSLGFDRFREVWDGTVLLAEKGEQTVEAGWPVYWIKQSLWFVGRTAKYWIAALAVYFLVWGAMRVPTCGELRYPVKFAGVVVSLLCVAKASFDPRLAQRFCRYGRNADCNEVFRSAGAKVFGWVSLGELSLAYFTASLVWGIFVAANPASAFPLIDAFALPFVVYSLVWQIAHRKWCTLCLAIDLVLLADFLGEVLLWGNIRNITGVELFPDLVNFGLSFALCLLALRAVIGLAEANRAIPLLKFRRERLLSSAEIFWLLLDRQPPEPVDSNDILAVCNFRDAAHTVTVVMNPSCPKCAKVHEAVGALKGYRINLVFIVNDGDQRSRHAALVMITSGMKYDWEVTDRVIRRWYEKHELPEFLEPHTHAEADLQAQMDYCRTIRVEGTPTVLVDNRRLPELYDIDDLKVLL